MSGTARSVVFLSTFSKYLKRLKGELQIALDRMGSINCKERSVRITAHAQQNGGTYVEKNEPEDDPNYVEAVVCNEDEINNNEMKQFELGDAGKILLVKQQDKLSALGTKCGHYGAILSTGALGKGRIRCPWHGACINIENGDIEDFPGLDSVPCHQVFVDNKGQVRVRAKKIDLEDNKRIKDMVKRNPDDKRSFVIIGGGPSGAICAETLRQEGYTGRIIVLCKEPHLPYDRVKVSKAMDVKIKKLEFRTNDFYQEHSIEIMKGISAASIDTNKRSIKCSNACNIKYDKLYIATGSRPAKPDIQGIDLENIFTLRDYADAEKIYKLLNSDIEIVCLGSSFISLEAAAYCANKVKKVTVIGRGSVPLQESFGLQVGCRVLKLFEENGVEMIMKSGIKHFIGEDGKVTHVEILSGRKIPCNLCILGTGSHLNTEFLKGSSIDRNPNGSVNVDMHLMTSIPDIFAGGDIAHAPVMTTGNQRATIGHYQLAQYHGRIAALNMAGKITDLRAVPFFWTMLFGKSFRYSGYGKPAEVRIEGDLAELKFVAMYFDKYGNVIAMASCMRDPIVAQFAELQHQGWRLHKNDLESGGVFGWTKWLHC